VRPITTLDQAEARRGWAAPGAVRCPFAARHAERPPLPAVSTLRTKARKAWELTHAGRYTELTDLLGSLVPDLETAVRALPQTQRPEVLELMVETYQACPAALARLGEPEA